MLKDYEILVNNTLAIMKNIYIPTDNKCFKKFYKF